MDVEAPTHYLVVDSDDRSVLAWFPFGNPDQFTAYGLARRLARDTGHLMTEGRWVGPGVITGWSVGREIDLNAAGPMA